MINRIKLYFLLSLQGLLPSCSGSAGHIRSFDVNFATESRDYSLEQEQNDIGKFFHIKLVSTSLNPICIGVDDWPNTSGKIAGGEGRAQVLLDGRSIAARDRDFGFCSGKSCIIRIEPHSEIAGNINYDNFGDPNLLSNSKNKILKYHIKPYIC